MAEILPEAPLIAFFCKSDAAFQEEAEHGPRPVLLAVTRSCPGQANWEHAGILCPTKKCHRPLWRWHFLDYLDMSQPAWLSWRTFLVCSTNVGCCFWAPWRQNLPANCACSLFLRAVASCRDTSSFFFFFTHFFFMMFSLRENCEETFPLWRFSMSSTSALWRPDARTRCREESCLLFLMGHFPHLCIVNNHQEQLSMVIKVWFPFWLLMIHR